MSGQGPKVNTGNNIGSINPIKTDGNSVKHADNHGNTGTQVNTHGDNGAQSIQGDNGKQANNSGTQNHPTFTF
uniref:Uncharacterized protein n=1 Tax=Picea sitchensis TaxID=3332 RepID=A9NJX0_PICSI|nr:unknown [Picea sitchensis]ABK21394.1 unknown [Picea sitchensis]ABK22643.1 unknown [Picea sitchensis]ABK23591.1 unknown [Picea sitchensis]ABK23595.1 unknown [Picea sitchensis]